ncbi:uncharacterized protein LOC116179351 isoform X2 [Photinus pyralis]|uniref:uncharacterized protein LOC116179351 isoform X2 n=1 Tax=Photinus pyralis TaxID=7054 RepID=UPI00126770A9|nr:uncharacterized protein LOC116179351 isoform X2 [Photinus pyralis]
MLELPKKGAPGRLDLGFTKGSEGGRGSQEQGTTAEIHWATITSLVQKQNLSTTTSPRGTHFSKEVFRSITTKLSRPGDVICSAAAQGSKERGKSAGYHQQIIDD